MSAAAAVAIEEAELLEILVPQLRRYLALNVDCLEIDRNGAIPQRLLEELGELGIFSLSIPTSYGGAGLSLASVCEVIAVLAEYDRAVATTVGLHLGLGTRGLIAYGSDHLKAAMLPKMASGEWIASFAATEANAGSDLTAIATTGVSDDSALVLRGAKAYVTNAAFAGVLTLLVATPGLGGARSHSLVCLRRDDEGLVLGLEEDKLGLRGSSTRPIFLDDVRIGFDRIIGEPGHGMELVHEVLAWGRTAMAAGCMGAARAAMNAASAYVQQRRQFGKSLIELPVVREQLATMSTLSFAIEALVAETAALEGDMAALAARSVAAKIFASEADWEITDTSLQLHGGVGFLETTRVAILLRDARITRIFEGANDVLRTRAGGLFAASDARREPLAEGRAGDALAAAGDAIAAEILDWAHGLRQTKGAGLLRDHRALHRMGSAWVILEVTDAVVRAALRSPDPVSRARAEHWLGLARQRLRPIFAEPAPQERLDRVVSALVRTAAP